MNNYSMLRFRILKTNCNKKKWYYHNFKNQLDKNMKIRKWIISKYVKILHKKNYNREYYQLKCKYKSKNNLQLVKRWFF